MTELTKNAEEILKRRYLLPGETPDDMFRRVARAIASVEADKQYWEEKFYTSLANLDFLPNSPTLANAGKDNGLAYNACYVLPVNDSIEEIFDAVKWAALIHKSGGGTGFSFSRLRPNGSRVYTTPGVASGPVSFATVFDAATAALKQGGFRRGANMGVLSIHHPDAPDFIVCKADGRTLSNFNISLAMTDEFMQRSVTNDPVSLRWGESGEHSAGLGKPHRELFQAIVENAWQTGDPGMLFIDRANASNPLAHLPDHAYEATNPCGEQWLPPFGVCNLGSINLSNFVVADGAFDVARFTETVHTAVRFLDNVIDATPYPLERVDALARLERRIGLGIMGYADALVKMGIRYGSDDALTFARGVGTLLYTAAHAASNALAGEKGLFPLAMFCQPMPYGRRNLTLTCIAPTGTISLIAGCSSGIEPYFAEAHERTTSEGLKLLYEENVPDGLLVTAHELGAEQHIQVQAIWQQYMDNAISKTINMPATATPDDISKAYLYAYQLGCKGITVYRDGSKVGQVLVQTCPECGTSLVHKEACLECPKCGYQRC